MAPERRLAMVLRDAGIPVRPRPADAELPAAALPSERPRPRPRLLEEDGSPGRACEGALKVRSP